MPNNPSGDWREYQRLVLAELERLNSVADKLDDKIVALRKDINDWMLEQEKELVSVKTRVTVYAGLISAAVGIAVTVIGTMLMKGN